MGDPTQYVEKILESYERTFGCKPKKDRPPLEESDHPKLDTSELCNSVQICLYQALIGQLMWAITLGRIDIAASVVTMSRFRQTPRIGLLGHIQWSFGYLASLPHGAIQYKMYSNLPHKKYDWARTVYSGAREEKTHDLPKLLRKSVTTTHYVDANLHHDLVTGKTVTAILHFVTASPVNWYSKRQCTVETSTFGSEFVAAKLLLIRFVDLRTALMYLSVPVSPKSYMFGDNKAFGDNASIPTSVLSKRSYLASYH